tara:strand:- start:413 stop:1210 length:798 start_codon:yes stop_codon:yes gene_type:complete
MANGKSVTKKKDNVVALVSNDMLFEDQGAGQEGIESQDLMIPRITILQSMSPQVNKRDGQYVDGAEVGSIFNTVSISAVDGEEGITVVPIKYRRAHIEWKANRGGFVADHGSDASILQQCTQDEGYKNILDNGNEIVVTGEFFIFVIKPDGSHEPAILSMTSSQLKKARRWNSMIQYLKVPKPDGGVFNPAMFYASYKLTTVPEENDQGSWFGWDIECLDGGSGGILDSLNNGQSIYLDARSFKERVDNQTVSAAPEAVADEDQF